MAIKAKTHKVSQINSLQFPLYFWTVAALAMAGVLDSIYLLISHYRVYTDIAYESFYAIPRSINCDTVSQSPYSIFIGIPVPVCGKLDIHFPSFFYRLSGAKMPRKSGYDTFFFSYL